MKIKAIIFLFAFIFHSCAVRKPQIQEGETIYTKGLLLVFSDWPERYFVECYEIIDTLNILENTLNEGNVGSAIYLHDFYIPINSFVSNNKQMTSLKTIEGDMVHAQLVKISYTEFYTLMSPEPNNAELHLENGIIRFDYKLNIHRINYIKGLLED